MSIESAGSDGLVHSRSRSPVKKDMMPKNEKKIRGRRNAVPTQSAVERLRDKLTQKKQKLDDVTPENGSDVIDGEKETLNLTSENNKMASQDAGSGDETSMVIDANGLASGHSDAFGMKMALNTPSDTNQSKLNFIIGGGNDVDVLKKKEIALSDDVNKILRDNCDKRDNNVINNCDNDVALNGKSGVKNNDPLNVNFNGNCDDIYLDSDMGPFCVHLTNLRVDDDVGFHDTIIGLKLKRMKICGIKNLLNVNRREIKVIFSNKINANEFLCGPTPKAMQLRAFIPKYNIRKSGIIFDIPTGYNEQQLMDYIDSDVPIVSIYRCQKRLISNGNKTKEWVPANTIKIEFRCQKLPDEVTFGYSKRKVKPDVPRVVQCFNCQRFGHPEKFCKQSVPTCLHCGTQHNKTNERCDRNMKCFHCHNEEHNAIDKRCPEFLRNSLIKEAMYYQNLTFAEANEEFPRTNSKFRLSEMNKEFPAMKQRKVEERVEASFPRKTIMDLKSQYSNYLALNQDIKSPVVSNNKSYSEAIKDRSEINQNITLKSGTTQCSNTPIYKEDVYEKRVPEEALKFIGDIQFRLQNAHTDPSQPNVSINNDLLLIEISNMIMDFMNNQKRWPVSYGDEPLAFSLL